MSGRTKQGVPRRLDSSTASATASNLATAEVIPCTHRLEISVDPFKEIKYFKADSRHSSKVSLGEAEASKIQ